MLLTIALLLQAAAAQNLAGGQNVTFETDDGVTIAASYYPPQKSKDAPAIVLVHQLGGTRAEWAPFIAALRADHDYALLAIDMRGHGASTRGPGGRKLAFGAFGDTDWHKLPQDVHAAVDWLRGRKDIAPRSVGAVGSSIGSSAVLIYAAPTVAVHAVALLSPGLDYHGLHTRQVAAKYGHRPLLIVAAQEDARSAQAAAELGKLAGRRAHVQIVPGTAHGTAMAASSPELIPHVVQFFRDNL